MASSRTKMKMSEDRGRECRRVIMLKTNKIDCIEKIVKEAKRTGVADITAVWRDFHNIKKSLLEVSLHAIAKVAGLKQVYVFWTSTRLPICFHTRYSKRLWNC
jgi:hypothetical protein